MEDVTNSGKPSVNRGHAQGRSLHDVQQQLSIALKAEGLI
jgi:hypothetical protein